MIESLKRKPELNIHIKKDLHKAGLEKFYKLLYQKILQLMEADFLYFCFES